MNKRHIIRCLATTCGAIVLGMAVQADAALYPKRLNVLTSDGLGKCRRTFNINPPNPFTVTNVNVRVGGSPAIEDPGRWQLFSPTDAMMSPTIFGFNVTTATHKWYEYNTSYHDGPLDTGQWELVFDEPPGGCGQYSALVTFDAM